VTDTLRVEVAYALPERQVLLALEVAPGTTAAEAVALARAMGSDPPVGEGAAIGVWGRVVSPGTALEDGDRVEVYRALPADPKETRRALARQGRTMGRPRA
jgi:hypothetical protein